MLPVQAELVVDLKPVEIQELARKQAASTFTELSFLDCAELALIGGGGAHGGNTL